MEEKDSKAVFEQFVDSDLELLLFLLHLGDQTYVALPLEHLDLGLNTDLIPRLFRDCRDAIDLTVDLQVVAYDHLTAKVESVFELLVKHGQNALVKLR